MILTMMYNTHGALSILKNTAEKANRFNAVNKAIKREAAATPLPVYPLKSCLMSASAFDAYYKIRGMIKARARAIMMPHTMPVR